MHKLTEKDLPARTGVCAVCGPVKIYAKGKSWICAEAKKRRSAGWAERNPDKAAANRATVSPHRLTNTDRRTHDATCSLCGEVRAVAYGRGWACPNTPGAKARAHDEPTPVKPCLSCRSYGNDVNPVDIETGFCKGCSPGSSLSSWNTMKPLSYEERKRISWEFYIQDELDYAIGFPRDPGEIDDRVAVPGWRVIGEGDPDPSPWKDIR